MHFQNQKNRMSACNIPFEIQSEIIKRVLPVKSLLRFRSVSKQWKSLIDSSEFIADHCANESHQHHLLVRYELVRYEVDSDSGFKYEVDPEYKYVSIVDDDDSFPQHKFSPVISPTVNLVRCRSMLDCSHGLVCLYGYELCGTKGRIVIWNPSIRKSVGVAIELSSDISVTPGFGVCPKTNDPKIVMIKCSYEIQPVNLKAEVFTLSSGAWRSIPMNIHFSQTTHFTCNSSVVADGLIYWGTYDASRVSPNRIISFDLISEEFGEVDLPDSLALGNLYISKLNKSLVVLHFDDADDYNVFEMDCDVWMLRTKNRFEKLFTVVVQTSDYFYHFKHYGVVGFRKNGQPIREQPCGEYGSSGTTLEAYDPSTKHTCDLGIHVDSDSAPSMITSYTESLLLLNNHSDYIIQG